MRMDAPGEMRDAAGDRLKLICIVERSRVRSIPDRELPDVSRDTGNGMQVPLEQQCKNQRCRTA